MSGMMEWMRQADWLVRRRLVAYSAIFVVMYVVAAGIWLAMSSGGIDINGRPIGPDFVNVWAAGSLALTDRSADIYEYTAHHEAQKAAFGGAHVPYFGWHYPPMFLLLALPLALLPYLAALSLWLLSTLPLFLLAVYRILPRRESLLLALAFPGVFVNLSHGQNGFLTAALLGGGLLLLERRPLLAGLLFGLLTYKPQFGLLIPLVLLLGQRWDTIVVAAGTAAFVAMVSLLLFGPETWIAFLDSLALTREVIVEQGVTGWHKIMSVFAAARMYGAGIELAYLIQAAVGICAMATVLWLWALTVPHGLKCAALVAATPLLTPYVLDYDLVILALPVAWLAADGLRRGFLPWEKLTLAAVWLLPLLSRPIGLSLSLPITPPLLMILLFVIFRRARSPALAGATPTDVRPRAAHA